jgi:hypothetical protein
MDATDDTRRPLLGTAKEDDIGTLSGRRPSSPPPSYNTASAAIEEDAEGPKDADMNLQNMSRKSQWIVLAAASGACAAFNGVFAKL